MARASFFGRTPVAASVLTLAAAVTALTGCGSSGSSSAGGSGKPLSQASITFGAGYNQADSSLIYIAQQNGYFKKQGLTVKIVNTAPLSTSDTVAAFFGGTYEFLNNAAATDILADVSSGGNEMTAIWQSTVGSHEQIAVNNNFAKQIGLNVHMGHGLNYDNVQAVAQIPGVEEFNIGHSIVSRAVLVGMERAVREMKEALRRG